MQPPWVAEGLERDPELCDSDRFPNQRIDDLSCLPGGGRQTCRRHSRSISGHVCRRDCGGLSCRQAAQRFGVSASSAIRWRALECIQGDARPKALGGDRRSGRIEARAGLILALVEETPDITLEELRAALARRGLAVGYGTLWRFFARRRITRKKRPHTRPSKTGRTS